MNFFGYNSNPLMGGFVPPSYALPQFGTDPSLRAPMQGSEPGLRMPQPSDTAPFNTQFGNSAGVDLLGAGTKLMDSSKPKEQTFEPLGLLMPQTRADFNSLYANYLKQMGLLA